MSWYQSTISLSRRSRGCYLITDEILQKVPQVGEYKIGLLTLFIQHTSAALTLNENWDSDVQLDMTDALEKIAPESWNYRHDAEGRDDMPAHIRSSLIGATVTIPIRNGKLATGTWQGIWLCEFRRSVHTRHVVATIQGEKFSS
ncbi:UPF0047-domain-containing protein [Limtongia smithiae]|uniref:UPF0047-domain-containing protein n=1 Tax=Limtongia smithiae TaxID=1125753 RepID=UPI0034D00C22